MNLDSCVGCDPGPTTGLCLLEYRGGLLAGRTVLQCDGGVAAHVLSSLLRTVQDGQVLGKRAGSVEKFVTGQAAGSRGKAADVTRQLVMELAEVLQLFGYPVKIRAAGDVKPWASDKRLAAALGMSPSDSLRHGWDAARHCLYGAKEAGVIRDPLLAKGAALHLSDVPDWLRRHP